MAISDIVFSTNIAGGNVVVQGVYHVSPRPAVHRSLQRAATCHVRTVLPGPEGVRLCQVLLYII